MFLSLPLFNCLLRHKLRHALPIVTLLEYTRVIRPKLEYACAVLDPGAIKNIHLLEKILAPVRFAYCKFRRTDSVSSLMRNNEI